MAKTELLTTIPLSGTDKGVISISNMNEPYGDGSNSVVSIGISLKGDVDNVEWKAHIPYANVDEVIKALKEAKEKFGK
jgi:hypothetical protein